MFRREYGISNVPDSIAQSSKISINQHHPTFSLLCSLHLNPHYQEFVTTQQSFFRDQSQLKLMQQNLKLWPCCSCSVAILSPVHMYFCAACTYFVKLLERRQSLSCISAALRNFSQPSIQPVRFVGPTGKKYSIRGDDASNVIETSDSWILTKSLHNIWEINW